MICLASSSMGPIPAGGVTNIQSGLAVVYHPTGANNTSMDGSQHHHHHPSCRHQTQTPTRKDSSSRTFERKNANGGTVCGRFKPTTPNICIF